MKIISNNKYVILAALFAITLGFLFSTAITKDLHLNDDREPEDIVIYEETIVPDIETTATTEA